MSNLPFAGLVLACADSIKNYIIHPLCGVIFQTISIDTIHNKLLRYGIFNYIRKKASTGTVEINQDGKEMIYTGVIYTWRPLIIFNIPSSHSNDPMVSLNNVDTITIHVERVYATMEDFLAVLRMESYLYRNKYIDVYSFDPTLPQKWELMNKLQKQSIKLYLPTDLLIQVERICKQKFGKYSLLIHGDPGVGKTTLIKYLATYLNKDIYTIDASLFFGGMLDVERNNVRSNTICLKRCEHNIILLEDIDRFFKSIYEIRESPDISKFLNFLDGVTTPTNIIFIMTANNIDDIPKVVRRDGRVHQVLKLPLLTAEVIKQISSDVSIEKYIDKPLATLLLDKKK